MCVLCFVGGLCIVEVRPAGQENNRSVLIEPPLQWSQLRGPHAPAGQQQAHDRVRAVLLDERGEAQFRRRRRDALRADDYKLTELSRLAIAHRECCRRDGDEQPRHSSFNPVVAAIAASVHAIDASPDTVATTALHAELWRSAARAFPRRSRAATSCCSAGSGRRLRIARCFAAATTSASPGGASSTAFAIAVARAIAVGSERSAAPLWPSA